MIYIVSGMPRSLTSAMTGALSAGMGLPIAQDDRRNKLNQRFGDAEFTVNPSFHELMMDNIRRYFFKPDEMHHYDNHIVKLLFRQIPMLAKSGINFRIVQMIRNPEEVRQSFDAAFLGQLTLEGVPKYYDGMSFVPKKMESRKDVITFDNVSVDKLLKDPLKEFEKLRSKGWNIDPIKAAEVIDPEEIRFKKEKLIPGEQQGFLPIKEPTQEQKIKLELV